MAFFIHKETGQLHPRTPELLEQVAQRVEREGIEAWQTLDPRELLGEEAAHYLKNKDINYVTDRCIMMFAEPVGSFHRIHKFFSKLTGNYPK